MGRVYQGKQINCQMIPCSVNQMIKTDISSGTIQSCQTGSQRGSTTSETHKSNKMKIYPHKQKSKSFAMNPVSLNTYVFVYIYLYMYKYIYIYTWIGPETKWLHGAHLPITNLLAHSFLTTDANFVGFRSVLSQKSAGWSKRNWKICLESGLIFQIFKHSQINETIFHIQIEN